MPAQAKKRWTADEARELNEHSPLPWPRYEVIDGELLVSPAPRALHQEAVLRLARKLAEYTDRQRMGNTMIGPADVTLEPDSTVSPDIFVARLVAGRKPRTWAELGGLHLVVEVLSPSTARHDRVVKRAYFARNDVPEYWIVDLDARLVERWHPGDERPDIIADDLAWMPEGAASAFTLDLVEFFADVHGEVG